MDVTPRHTDTTVSCGSDTYYLVPAANTRKTIVQYHETIQEIKAQKDHLKLYPWNKTKFLLLLRDVTSMLIWIFSTMIFAVSTTLYCVLDVESAGSRVGRNVITSHIMLGPAWTLQGVAKRLLNFVSLSVTHF